MIVVIAAVALFVAVVVVAVAVVAAPGLAEVVGKRVAPRLKRRPCAKAYDTVKR